MQENANEKNTRTSANLTESVLEASVKEFQYDILRLKRMVEEKVKEVEDITAEKEELESSVQSALHKLWTKEAELHTHRETSIERERCLQESLNQESAHSEELQIQVQSLTNQNDALQEQVLRVEQQLSMVKGVTEKRRRELEHKLPELESTQESLKKMTVGLMGQIVDVMSAQNKQASRTVDLPSSTSIEETSSELSCSEKYSDSTRESGTEDDLSTEAKTINLKEEYHDLRNEMKNLTSSVEDFWHKINLDSKTDVKEPTLSKEPKILLRDIYQVYCQEKSKVVDLEEQNTRQLKHLQDVQEALCLTEGRIQRIWVNISLYEERDEEISSAWRRGHSSIEETEDALQRIETVLSSNKCTLQENQELKRLNASQEKKVNDLQELVAKARKEESDISKQLEIRNAKIEELMLSTNKTIEDKDVEIEILKEQLQENEKKEEELKQLKLGNKCTDETLEKLLQSKERDFETYKKRYEKKELALLDEVRDLQEALERAKREKNDLDEYCSVLTEAFENTESHMNSAADEEKSLKETLVQAKKKEEKLYLAARELYDEFQTKRHETASQETTIAALHEKIKCLEMEIQTIDQERQVDKKNLKNAKDTEQYLQTSLQQALGELFELKAKNEEMYEGSRDQLQSEQEDDHQEALQERLQELESMIHTALEKSAQDLQEYAVRIDELCEENDLLKKEFNEYKKTSTTLQKTNYRLKTLLQAMKDDLLEELKAKKELEILLVKSNDKTEPLPPEYNQCFDEQSTTSQMPGIKEVDQGNDPFISPSDSCLQTQKKTGKLKVLGKNLIPKAISKHLSSSSLNATSPRKQKKNEPQQETTNPPKCLKVVENDLKNEKLEKLEALEREQRLRNVLMTIQHNKEELELVVESLTDELQSTKAQLQKYGDLYETIREEANRNARETMEMKKVLEVIYGRTKRAHSLINKDIHSLLEVSKAKDKRVEKLEQFAGKYEKETAELQSQVATLKEKLEDEVTLKEVALEEGRQLRVSLKNVLESKENCFLSSEPPLLINNLNSDAILPQMGKDEVRAILKEILQDIECSSSEEVNRLKQRLADQMEELFIMKRDNEYLKTLVDAGLHEELQRAEERIIYLSGQLKASQDRQNVLREESIRDKVKANEETDRLYERLVEMKITIKSKEEALERYKELEEVLMTENTQLQGEIDGFKERFGADGLLPLTQKAESKRAMEGWKRKCQRLEENFEKEKNDLKQENIWLHKQLAEESSLCEELRRCKAGLEDSLKITEDRLKALHRKLEERQEAHASFEERRVALQTKLSCLQKVNDDLQKELSKERLEADRNLMVVRNEFEATAKDLKRHQREGNNLLTKVFLLENAKEKLEQELNEKERKMTVSLASFSEERSRLSEKVRDLRISLEDEVRRRLDLEEKMQQIVKISVAEREQGRLKAIIDASNLDQNAQVKFLPKQGHFASFRYSIVVDVLLAVT